MNKLNKYSLAMRIKYGCEWDAPLFIKTTNSPEPDSPQPVPDIINDATEEKAAVFETYNKTNDAKALRAAVFSAFRKLTEATDNDVCRYLRKYHNIEIPPSTVSARRNELRDRGLLVPVLDQSGRKKKKIDERTNTLNTLWRVTRL